VLGGAALTVLAYPPFHLFMPSFVCLVPAVLLVARGAGDARPLRRHLVQGWWFGLTSHGLVLYWMVYALWHFTPLSALGYAATIAILALLTAATFAATGWIGRAMGIAPLLSFPVLWTALEWIVGHQGDIRFPWLGLGTSLTGFPTVVQIAEVIGARGVTLALAAANTALAYAWLRRTDRRRAIRLVLPVVAGVGLAAAYGVMRQRVIQPRESGTVTLLQPAVEEKVNADRDSIARDLFALHARALRETDPDLVLWPEAALPDFFQRHPDWERQIQSLVQVSRVPLVAGGIDLRRRSAGGFDWYNAAFVFDSTGRRDAWPVYHKRFLVPIVERVPFVNPRWFAALRWFGAFGVGDLGAVYQIGSGGFGILICYESAFEELARHYRRNGADFLVNITNDAWFGRTAAPYQHAAHLVMRAIENRVGIARAANTGISEFVDPLGRATQRTRLGERAIVEGAVLTTDIRTFYTMAGDWVGTLAVGATALLLGAAWWKERKRA
jgi:apolipoprotein N-acyltransferase